MNRQTFLIVAAAVSVVTGIAGLLASQIGDHRLHVEGGDLERKLLDCRIVNRPVQLLVDLCEIGEGVGASL